MPSKFRYVAAPTDRIEKREELGPASYLHDFLIDHQTDADGNVYYGRAISYAWIRSRWHKAATIRTLKRHMARLKEAGLARVTKLPYADGMKIQLLRSVKWTPQPAQASLFPPPEILSISGGKDVKKLSNSRSHVGTKVSPLWGQKCPHKEVKNLREETNYCEALASARSPAVENAAALDERRRLLADQARMLEEKYKSAG